MTTPISVLLSVHNGKTWLAECIESVLGQSFSDFEFLIVDDGSTDSSPEVARQFARRDSRIRTLEKKNSGLADSLNYGMSHAKGAWIARIDADDICMPDRLELQLREAQRLSNCVLLGSAKQMCLADGTPSRLVVYPTSHEALTERLLSRQAFFPHSSAFINANAARTVGGYRPRIARSQDYDLWLRLSAVGTLGCLQRPLVFIRQHSSQLSNADAGYRQMVFSFAALASFHLRENKKADPVDGTTSEDEFAQFMNLVQRHIARCEHEQHERALGEIRAMRNQSDRWLLKSIGLLAGRPALVPYVIAQRYLSNRIARRIAQDWEAR